jgi:para-nitrobenzyl esterase
MKIFLNIILFLGVLLVQAQTSTPTVKIDSTYRVIIKKDITYAEGLAHNSTNSSSSKVMPLQLDLYCPDNSEINRPAIFLIHGGGFSGGNKEHKRIVDMATYFASRGFVAISINYRLRKYKGTVPKKWTNYAANHLDEQFSAKFLSIYPAIRDAKAALRWLCANAESYQIDTNYITVGGASAGAMSAIALGLSDKEDFVNEISLEKDPTLKTTNLNQPYKVKTIIDFWGSAIAIKALKEINNPNSKLAFWGNDSNSTKTENSQALNLAKQKLPPMLIVHGEEDVIVKYSHAKDLKNLYLKNNVIFEFHSIPNTGHGIWNKTANNKSLNKLALDFIIAQQKLIIP